MDDPSPYVRSHESIAPSLTQAIPAALILHTDRIHDDVFYPMDESEISLSVAGMLMMHTR